MDDSRGGGAEMSIGDEPIGGLILKGAVTVVGTLVLISLLFWALKWGLILAVVGTLAYGIYRLIGSVLGADRGALEGLGDDLMLTQQPEGGLIGEADDVVLDVEANHDREGTSLEADPLAREIERAARGAKST